MKQVVQSLRDGNRKVLDVPAPAAAPGQVVIANRVSLISAGTEKAAIDLASASLWRKARERPDQVRRVLEKVRNEGLLATYEQVRGRLEQASPMGYSSAGTVVAVGAGVRDLRAGDRVASNGPHAGVVSVPRHLCARIPEGVEWDQAAFTVLGAIALQGVRLGRCEVGATVFVIGLGLVGQLVVAIARASGLRVIATDLDPDRCKLALRMGADEAAPAMTAADVEALTGGLGADAVLIAAATSSDGPVTLAGEAVRKKGRVVSVGAVGMNLPRRPYYFKECEFVVSCSYGPGRYDPEYEERGHDYPAAYVRWTEQRNMETVLRLIATGAFDPRPLVSHRFTIEQAEAAYDLLDAQKERFLALLLEYSDDAASPVRSVVVGPGKSVGAGVGVGVLGAGGFARSTLIPILQRQPDVRLAAVCSARGLSALDTAAAAGFERAVSDEQDLLRDDGVGAVVVATRHGDHARQVCDALRAGKSVFVEKPLGLTLEEIAAVEKALPSGAGPVLMVGFNRRFAAATRAVKEFFGTERAPLSVQIRFNVGAIEADHWVQDEGEGGGRLIGEGCHAIDLATFLHGSPPVRVFAESIGGATAPPVRDDQVFVTLRHADGGITSLGYLAGGDRSISKERVEVIGGGRVAVIDDYRRIVLTAGGKSSRRKFSSGKGHEEEIRAFLKAVRDGGEWPIDWNDLRAVSVASILAVRSLREGLPMELP